MEKRFLLKKDLIDQLCSSQKISKGELSDLLNITQSTFSCKVSGKATCSYEEVSTLSDLFNIPFYNIASFSVSATNTELEKTSVLLKNSVLDKDLFKDLLKKENLTKLSFSKIIGSSVKSIDRWCCHAGNPNPKTAITICKYFDIPLKTMFKDGKISPYPYKHPSKEENVSSVLDDIDEEKECKEFDSATGSEVFNSCELNLETFEEGNVLGNMKVINNNLVLLANYISAQLNSISDRINSLNGRIDDVERSISSIDFSSILETEPKQITKASVILPMSLSDAEVLSICKKDCKHDDYSTYKDKIQKLLAYIGKRKNLVYNQVAHDFYKTFERVYGMSLMSMKKGYSKDVNTINIIYDDKATREIFFNIVATEASHLAGDRLVINN